MVMRLTDQARSRWPEVWIESIDGAKIVVEQSRISSKRQIWWKIRANADGYHNIVFDVDGERITKELAVGDGFMRVSSTRPGWSAAEILQHPWERPFGTDSVVSSLSIYYPKRGGSFFGIDIWVIYFLVVSMVFALIFKPFLKVRI